jgi:urease accessory protein
MKLTNLNLKLGDSYSRTEPVPARLEKVEALPDQHADGLQIVPVVMTAEERRKIRRRLVFSDGVEIGLAFPTGTVLLPGTILHRTLFNVYRVEAALEPVLVITPETVAEAAKIAHFIGNLHRDIDVQDEAIVVLYEPALEIRLQKLGYAVVRENRIFMGRPTGSDAHTA